MISNCSIDERGKISGGKPGDNNGKEWLVRSWYNYPWNCVLRANNAEAAALMADMAKAAAQNNNIGYNQYKRTTFWTELEKANYKPENIKTACDADCSAAVAAIAKAVGYRLNIAAMKGININAYTGNLKAALKAAGFTILTDSKYLTSDKYLLPGDVLLKEGKHTCINLSKGSKAEAAVSTPTIGSTDIQKWQQAAVKDGFNIAIDGIWGAECEKVANKAIIKKRITYKYKNLTKYLQSKLGIEADGKCGNQTKAAIKAYQQKNNLVADGECGIITWKNILSIGY